MHLSCTFCGILQVRTRTDLRDGAQAYGLPNLVTLVPDTELSRVFRLIRVLFKPYQPRVPFRVVH